MIPSTPSACSAVANSCPISAKNVDFTRSLPRSSSSNPVNAAHHSLPSDVLTVCSKSCPPPAGGSTATISCPFSFIRRRTTVSACASISCVGSCCSPAMASSIFSFPRSPSSRSSVSFSSIIISIPQALFAACGINNRMHALRAFYCHE